MKLRSIPQRMLYSVADYLQAPYNQWKSSISGAHTYGLFMACATKPDIPLSVSRGLSKVGDITRKLGDLFPNSK